MDYSENENVYGHQARLQWLKKHVKQEDQIVEFGCGTGYMITIPLSLRGFNIVGADLDEKSIAYGRNLLEAGNENGDILQVLDIRELPYQPDVIVASEVLEHIPDDELNTILGYVYDSLVEGGKLLVTVPNGYGAFEIESFLWYRLKIGKLVGGVVARAITRTKRVFLGKGWREEVHPSTLSDSPHVQRFTYRSIKKLLKNAGFEVVSSEGSTLIAGPFSNLLVGGIMPLLRLNRWLGKRMPYIASGFYLECIKNTNQ